MFGVRERARVPERQRRGEATQAVEEERHARVQQVCKTIRILFLEQIIKWMYRTAL